MCGLKVNGTVTTPDTPRPRVRLVAEICVTNNDVSNLADVVYVGLSDVNRTVHSVRSVARSYMTFVTFCTAARKGK